MRRPLILDGAMGTELKNRGIDIPLPIWSADANLEYPEVVVNIHSDYISAGADIITTNTFRTTTWTYRRAGHTPTKAKERARDSLLTAVECAQNASNKTVQIAGSITSVEDCYSPDKFPGKTVAEDIYGETLEWMMDGGVDLILFETMGNIHEVTLAMDMTQYLPIPLWLSLIMKDNSRILDGTPIQDLLSMIHEFKVDCLLTNCNQLGTTLSSIDQFNSTWKGDWGAYPNMGITDYENDYFETIDESNFSDGMTSILNKDPDVIGVCCGSRPYHVKLLKSLVT
jgi:homocysteine S-methyltransferase